MWANTGLGRELARGLDTLRDEVRELRKEFDAMTRAEEIANTVTAQLRDDRRQRWTRPRLVGTGLVSLVLAVPAVHDLAGWLFG